MGETGGLLFWARVGAWENVLVGGWVRIEERMAAGSVCVAERRYIPVPAMVDVEIVDADIRNTRRRDLQSHSRAKSDVMSDAGR